MKALIFNSGLGKRMGEFTKQQPKCLVTIGENETVISRQLRILLQAGIKDVVMTTGPHGQLLMDYCNSLRLPLKFTFVFNPIYQQTNYIYSLYLALKHLDDSFLMLHGDLVFETSIVQGIVQSKQSVMAVSTTQPLPSKDFKARLKNGRIARIGVDLFDNAVTAQPLYKLDYVDWCPWKEKVISFCEQGRVSCYAEDAFNEVSEQCLIYPYDYKDNLCVEIDTPKDLMVVKDKLASNALHSR